jgi:hypothetical protein
MSDAKQYLDDIYSRIEHIDTVLCGGSTKDGCYFLSTPKTTDIGTLKAVRKMISDHIKELKEHNVKFMHEIR